ncbi:hypothetical protein DPMN_161700 [Dreissena polymorpha]|uniref:Uncharacterized protein n=1 Tax=Dreissena polymorpha TaxID=45954 RepID=A0A9D4IPW5_DREPO|nr:hypothetical protein DPMN_161700 [Dreissena polymorpha]
MLSARLCAVTILFLLLGTCFGQESGAGGCQCTKKCQKGFCKLERCGPKCEYVVCCPEKHLRCKCENKIG